MKKYRTSPGIQIHLFEQDDARSTRGSATNKLFGVSTGQVQKPMHGSSKTYVRACEYIDGCTLTAAASARAAARLLSGKEELRFSELMEKVKKR